ncbi:hypothetical protein [Sutcliffiella cohnii]|uniref:hypothetical protein n=1 Tax=Sutcliffiella cohnii TaxID=33932 RepID=UPI00082AF5F9|nr:hypothetical protein [Sutcliffiella cohnii]
MKYQIVQNGETVFADTAEDIRIWLEHALMNKLNYFVMLQESEDDEELEVYLHSEYDEELDSDSISKLKELAITESNSLQAICKVLNITIK